MPAQSGDALEHQTEHVGNPYAGAIGYVNAQWAANVLSTAQSVSEQDAVLAGQMEKVAQQSTAVWMDKTAAIEGDGDNAGLRAHLDAALEQQSGDEPVVVTVVVYNLPGVYTYLDAGHSGWLGWESNSQPTAELFAQVVSGTEAGFDSVDGFATNVANYTPVEEPYLDDPELVVGGQPVKAASFYEWNPDLSESDYAADLYARLVAAGFPSDIGMIVDTSRNGWSGAEEPTAASSASDVETYVNESRTDRRTHRGAWCNQSGAGLGYLPQAEPSGYESAHIDAFVWVKPPGESDGSSAEVANDQGKGADPMCDPDYVAPGLGNQPTGALASAPLSGEWFSEQFVELVRNAKQQA